MLISSGDAGRPYRAINLVVGFASQMEGWQGDIAIEDVYEEALQRLEESAKKLHANAILFVNFQNRVAIGQTCSRSGQVFEVFAWGTAVRWVKADE